MPNNIGIMREARALTLEGLAKLVGTTNQQISNLETGRRRLTVDWLRRLGTALKCHPWTLVSDGDLPGPMQPMEVRMLEAFRALGVEHRKALVLLATSLGVPSRAPRGRRAKR